MANYCTWQTCFQPKNRGKFKYFSSSRSKLRFLDLIKVKIKFSSLSVKSPPQAIATDARAEIMCSLVYHLLAII